MNCLPGKMLLLLCICISSTALAQNKIRLSSPDGRIAFRFSLEDGQPAYAVKFKQTNLVEHSKLGLIFLDEDAFGPSLRTGKPVFMDGEDDYTLPFGKTSHVHDFYKEVLIPLQESAGKKRLVNLHVRAFNDGLAFRYEFPEQPGWTNYTLTDENTSINLSGNPLARVAYLENFVTSHEHRYSTLPYQDIPNDTLMDMPALFEYPGNIYMGITEANLVNYAGMSLMKKHGKLQSVLSPLPGQTAIKVKASLPHHSPWRVMMISARVGALIESNLITNLSEPNKAGDVSWLKPGKATFHWWNGDIMPDTTYEPGVNFGFNKYYIDFCARNGIAYHSVIGYRGVAWYKNDGIEYQPGPGTDVTTPRPNLDMQDICDYAKSQGVGIRIWIHWAALYPKLDSAFTLYEKWGLKGMMVDFMDRDDQEMVKIQETILQKAAQHHLEIQFHGAFKPTGLSRTYPNESTREGTLNYENNKGGNLITPEDDIFIPFTRLLAGPTDYHLGGFRAMPASNFKVTFTRPHMLGTRCHMLAMYVVLENHVSMICDYPEAYEGQDGFDFLKEVPTVWDETKVVDAGVCKWITMARRKGDDWYIGTIADSTEKTVSVPLNFLAAGKYEATIYSDAPDAATEPNHLVKTVREVDQKNILQAVLAAGGGQVIKLHKIN